MFLDPSTAHPPCPPPFKCFPPQFVGGAAERVCIGVGLGLAIHARPRVASASAIIWGRWVRVTEWRFLSHCGGAGSVREGGAGLLSPSFLSLEVPSLLGRPSCFGTGFK